MFRIILTSTIKKSIIRTRLGRYLFCQQNQFTQNKEDLHQQLITLQKQLTIKQKDYNTQVNILQEIIKLKRLLYESKDAPEDLVKLGILYNACNRNEEALQIVNQIESNNYINDFQDKDKEKERDMFISQFITLKCRTNSNNILYNLDILKEYVTKHEGFVNAYCPVYKEFTEKQSISQKVMNFDDEYTFLINYQILIGLLAELQKGKGLYNFALKSLAQQLTILDGLIRIILKAGQKEFKVQTTYQPETFPQKYQQLLIDKIILLNKMCEILVLQKYYPEASIVVKGSINQLKSFIDGKMMKKSNSIYIDTLILQYIILNNGNLEVNTQQAIQNELENIFQEIQINDQNAELIVTYELFKVKQLKYNPEKLVNILEQVQLPGEILFGSYMEIIQYYEQHQKHDIVLNYYCKILFDNNLAQVYPKQYSYIVELAIQLSITLQQYDLARKILINLKSLQNYPIQEFDSYFLIQETKIKFTELINQKNNNKTQQIQNMIEILKTIKTKSEMLTFDKDLLIGEMYKIIGNIPKAKEYYQQQVEFLKKDPNRQELLAQLQAELEQMK